MITKATWGGAQRYVHDLALSLPRNQFESMLAYGQGGRLSETLANQSFPVYPISGLGRDIALVSDVMAFFAIARLLRKIRPDVLHLNSSKAAALGALAGRLAGTSRIVFTVHGWPFKEDRRGLSGGIM